MKDITLLLSPAEALAGLRALTGFRNDGTGARDRLVVQARLGCLMDANKHVEPTEPALRLVLPKHCAPGVLLALDNYDRRPERGRGWLTTMQRTFASKLREAA